MSRLIAIAFLLIVPLANAADGDEPAVVMVAPSRVPAWLIDVPPTVTDILVAETGAARMHRFVRSRDGIVEMDQRYMSIGTNGAGKERAWDRRTPLGVYFITDRLDTSKLHEKYGVAAFPLDYPNAWDRINGRTGYGIWLHGVDRNSPERPPLDTDGCLALPNEELLKLTDRLEPWVTPVIVTREMRWALPREIATLRRELRAALETWRGSLADGDIVTYLSLYADDFRYRDMDRSAWASYRLNVFESRPLAGVSLRNVFLVADPEVPGLYLSRFTQELNTADGPVTTMRRLYWRHAPDEGWQIVSEDAG